MGSPGAARDVWEKIDAAAKVQRFAKDRGGALGPINPNVFQGDDLQLLAHRPVGAVRGRVYAVVCAESTREQVGVRPPPERGQVRCDAGPGRKYQCAHDQAAFRDGLLKSLSPSVLGSSINASPPYRTSCCGMAPRQPFCTR